MSVNLSPLGGAGWQFLDNSGNVLSGGLLYTYSAGTTTPLTTYQDATGTTANANPVVLDAAGRVSGEVWLTAGLNYKFVLKTSTGTTLWTADNISGGTDAAASVLAQLAASGGSSLIGFLQSGTGAVATTVQSKLRETVSVKDFGAVGDGVTDDTAAIQAALNYAATAYAKVFMPRGDYKITSGLTLSSATTLYGEGIDQSVIRYYGTGGTALMLEGTVGTSKVKINLYDFALYDQGTGVNGVNMYYCHYSNLARLRIYGFQSGLVISNCWNNEYEFIVSENNTQDGFNLSTTDANSLNFISCQAVGNARAGFYSEGGRSVLLSQCTLEANGQYGAYIAAGSVNRPLSHTLHGCYIEGNGTFEVYIDTTTAYVPYGIVIRDCYFEYIATKATTAIRIADVSTAVIDGCTFDNQGGNYSYSLYMAAGGNIENVKWGQNFDSSTNGVYSEVYYENEQKLESRAWGRFTVSGSAIATVKEFGVANITYISAGIYEVTLRTPMTGTNYCVTANAENGSAYVCMFCNVSPPSSTTVFRILTASPAGASADARTVSFVVHD